MKFCPNKTVGRVNSSLSPQSYRIIRLRTNLHWHWIYVPPYQNCWRVSALSTMQVYQYHTPVTQASHIDINKIANQLVQTWDLRRLTFQSLVTKCIPWNCRQRAETVTGCSNSKETHWGLPCKFDYGKNLTREMTTSLKLKTKLNSNLIRVPASFFSAIE